MISFFRKKPAESSANMRLDADPADLREYDAFGPWIYPVRTRDDMPRRFRECYEELQSSTFFFKIPVNADRAAMRPGMDLYRSVLAVYPERVVVLDLNGSAVTRRDIAMETIEAVRTSSDLLPSILTIYLAEGDVFRLDYNAVSSHEIDKLVDFLRERVIACRASSQESITNRPERPGRASEEIRDFFYHGMWEARIRHAPSVRIVHWEPPAISCRQYGGWGRSSLGCLMLDEGGDLVVINRGQFMRGWLETVYSIANLYIPWAAVQAAELIQKPSGRKRFIPTIRLTLQSHVFDLELFAPRGELLPLLASLNELKG